MERGLRELRLAPPCGRDGARPSRYGRDGARPSQCGRDRLAQRARPTLRPRRSAALPVGPQGQWSPCHSQRRVRKPFGSTKAPRQWFSNDLPLVCASAVLPCAPCRAPTVRLCSAQGKALRKDDRGTGMAEERIERSPRLSQAFGGGLNGLAARSTRRRSTTGSLPVGGELCEALSQWQNRCFALGARTGRARQNCWHSVRFQNNGFTKHGVCRGGRQVGDRWATGGRAVVLPHLAVATERAPPRLGRDGARPSRFGGTARPTLRSRRSALSANSNESE